MNSVKHGSTQFIDLSAPNERQAVIRPCIWCKRDTAVAADFQGQIFCSDKCAEEVTSNGSKLRDTLQKFADATPDFYPCQYNSQQLVEAYQSQRISEWSVRSLQAAFKTLSAEGTILQKLSLADIKKMSPEEYDNRLRLDPNLGGHRAAIDGGALSTESQRRPVESAQPGFVPGNRVQQMQAIAQRELSARANSYTNRYKVSAFQNGEPVPGPELQQGLQQFRNGRLVR